MHASQETNQTVTPWVRPKEVTDPWSKGATEEFKIWHDESVQVDLTVLD